MNIYYLINLLVVWQEGYISFPPSFQVQDYIQSSWYVLLNLNRTQRVCVYPAQRFKTSAQCEEEHLTARASRSKNNDLRMKFIFVFPRTRTPEVYLPSRFKRVVEQNSNKNHLWNSGTTNVLWSFTASQKLPNSPLSGAKGPSGAQAGEAGGVWVFSTRLCLNLCLGHITTQTLLRGFARRIFIFGQVEPHQWQLVSWMILVFSPSLLSITIRSCQVASVTLLLLLVVASRNLHLQFKTFYIHNRSYKTFYIHSRSYKTFYVRSRS